MSQTTLTNQNSQLTIEHLGARIILTLNNTPILTKLTRGDGKTGSTHPCTPNFDLDHQNLFGLNRHGSTRNEHCQVEKLSDTQIQFTHNISDPGYPSGLHFQQLLNLEPNSLTIKTTHTNTGDQPTPINFGEHCYFHAPQGFTGTTINNQDITNIITQNPNGKPLAIKPTNIINIPDLPPLTLTQQNLNFVMLWVGSDPDGNKDTDYICIEPVTANPHTNYLGSPESLIQPEDSHTNQFTLSIA